MWVYVSALDLRSTLIYFVLKLDDVVTMSLLPFICEEQILCVLKMEQRFNCSFLFFCVSLTFSSSSVSDNKSEMNSIR